MNNIEKYINEFESMSPVILNGLYSLFDSKVLYAVVRCQKPLTIVDCAPKEGRTTSVIIQALLKNLSQSKQPINYFLFERDELYLDKIKQYCKDIPNINFHLNGNIIGFDFMQIPKIDFLFIDANHDYILARWFKKYVFPLVADDGVIHVHDIYYNKNNKGWHDAVFANTDFPKHPDLVNIDILKGLYGNTFNEFFDGAKVSRDESDELMDYLKENPKIVFVSTIDLIRELNRKDITEDKVPSCSMYLFKGYAYT